MLNALSFEAEFYSSLLLGSYHSAPSLLLPILMSMLRVWEGYG